jgi:hypothetical protein
VPIAAKLVADLLTAAGVHRVLTMDLHAEQIQGFFNIPVDNIYSLPIMLGDVWKKNFDHLMVVSPDVGGVVRARALAKRLECDLAIIDKRRPKANVSEVMNIIGEVEGRTCVIMDDIVDTAGTCARRRPRSRNTAPSRSWPTASIRCFPAMPSIADQSLGSRRTGRHRHHSAVAKRRSKFAAHSPAVGGRGAGRNDSPHQQRGFGFLALHRIVRRFFSLNPLPGRGRGLSYTQYQELS